MQYTQKEILDALELIKNVCWEQQDDCKKCPLYSVTNCCCIFRSDVNPDEWELNSPDKTWHAVFQGEI